MSGSLTDCHIPLCPGSENKSRQCISDKIKTSCYPGTICGNWGHSSTNGRWRRKIRAQLMLALILIIIHTSALRCRGPEAHTNPLSIKLASARYHSLQQRSLIITTKDANTKNKIHAAVVISLLAETHSARTFAVWKFRLQVPPIMAMHCMM